MEIKVLALIGKSGSGKTTISEILRAEGYNVIDSYTIRPKRYENETGHIFTDAGTLCSHRLRDIDRNDRYIVALNNFDGNMYWATIDQFVPGWNVYVVDADGFIQLRLFDNLQTVGVYINADSITRIRRMQRDRGTHHAMQRIAHDEKAFKIIECDYTIDNPEGKLQETIQSIKDILNNI